MSPAERKKSKFRASQKWKKFRKDLKKKQQTDPITGSKLTPRSVCHHLDLREENYEMVSEERQVMVNPLSHDLIHYVFGDGNKYYDWRERLENLKKICERMEQYKENLNGNQETNS